MPRIEKAKRILIANPDKRLCPLAMNFTFLQFTIVSKTENRFTIGITLSKSVLSTKLCFVRVRRVIS